MNTKINVKRYITDVVDKRHRVFICADRKFPHGDAGGNRIEYMAKSLISQGMDIYVVSLGENLEKEWNEADGLYLHDGIIPYKNIIIQTGKYEKISWYFHSGKKVADAILPLVNSDDIVIIYTSNPIFGKQIENNISARYQCKFIYDVVEWFDESCYAGGKFNPRYWVFNYCFYNVYPKADGIIAISKNIEKHFLAKKCRTTYFPICLDASVFHGVAAQRFDDVIRLIYPGNPEHKDDVETMLQALTLLDKNERKRVEFHFTSVSRSTIKNILHKGSTLLEDLQDIVFFHDWMAYDELINLYGSMDALFMLRKNNLVTKSNFPSKVPELLSCGAIVIANNSGDFFSFLKDGENAIKISGNQAQDCVQAIRKLLMMNSAGRKRMSMEAIKCAETDFSYLRYAKQLSEFVWSV